MLHRPKNKVTIKFLSILAFSTSSLANTIFPDITYQSLQNNKPILVEKNSNSSSINGLLSKKDSLSEVKIINDSTLTIDEDKFYGYITTDTNGAGQVDFKIERAIAASLGDRFNNLGLVTFGKDAKIYGSSYVKVIEIAPNTTVTFNNNINAEPGDDKEFKTTIVQGGVINLTGIRATAVFGDGTYVGSNIESDITGQGAVRATGNVSFNKIGKNANNRIDKINLYENDTIVQLRDNIYTRTIDVDEVALDVNKDVTLDANKFTCSDSNIKLNQHTLTIIGDSKLEKTIVLDTKVTGDAIGNIIVDGSNSKLDLSDADLIINLIPDNTSVLSATNTTKTYNVISSVNNGTILPSNQVSFQVKGEQNRYVKWNYDQSTHTVTLENNLKDFSSDLRGADPAVIEFAESLINDPNLSSDALRILNTAASMSSADAADLLDNTIPDLLSTEEIVDENSIQSIKSFYNRLSSSVSAFASRVLGESNSVAAGDEENNYGAWITPFYGQSIQKDRKLNDGYKTRNYGVTLGADTKLSEESTVGIGVSHIRSVLENTRNYVDDKGKVNTYILSTYGQYNLPKNYFIQGIISYGQSYISNNETRKITPEIKELAQVKYKTRNYGIQFLLGNEYSFLKSYIFKPMVGLRYNGFSNVRYKETGTSNENLSVYKKAVNRVEGVIGGKVSALLSNKKLTIKPMIQGFINNNLTNKKPVTITTLDGLSSPLPSRAEKPERLSYDIGAGINIDHKNMEFSVIHEIELERRFIAHQTMLGFKFHF